MDARYFKITDKGFSMLSGVTAGKIYPYHEDAERGEYWRDDELKPKTESLEHMINNGWAIEVNEVYYVMQERPETETVIDALNLLFKAGYSPRHTLREIAENNGYLTVEKTFYKLEKIQRSDLSKNVA